MIPTNIAQKYRDRKSSRVVIAPATVEAKSERQLEADTLQELLKNKIHPGIYGYPKGKTRAQLIAKLLLLRANGKYMVFCDFRNAFESVDKQRLNKLLRKHGVLHLCGLDLVDVSGNRIPFAGIPQGDPRSPMMFALYITPLMWRLSEYGLCFAYGDDLIMAADNEQDAAELIDRLHKSIERHSYRKSRLKLSEKPHKKIRVVAPSDSFELLGLKFIENVPLLGNGKSARSWFLLLQEVKNELKKRIKSNEEYRLLLKLNEIVPPTGITTDSSRVLHPLQSAEYVGTLSPSAIAEGMENTFGWTTNGVGGFVGSAAHPNFSSRRRAEAWQEGLWKQNKYLRDCFEKYHSEIDTDKKQSLFCHFIDELETRFLMLYPHQTLSYTFHLHKGKVRVEHEDLAKDLFIKQLQVINGFSGFDEVSGGITFLEREKLKQILRGITNRRWLSLQGKRKIPVQHKLIMALGTFTYPFWYFWDLRKICLAFIDGKISGRKFDKLIKAQRETIRTSNS